jgi:hypothetical protein
VVASQIDDVVALVDVILASVRWKLLLLGPSLRAWVTWWGLNPKKEEKFTLEWWKTRKKLPVHDSCDLWNVIHT